MEPICHICNSKSRFYLNKDDFDLFKCSSCGLVFVSPQPQEDFLVKSLYSYESGYQSNRARQDLSSTKEQERFTVAFDYLEKIKSGGKVLDVGCGNGQMLYWAKKRGFNPFGVEVNERTALCAKSYGFDVYIGLLRDSHFPKKTFDIIFLGEIIEHVNSPKDFIEECSEFLKDDGVIAITTPNINCYWSKTTFFFYKIFKIPWSSVTPPYHLFQFDYKNLDLFMGQFGFICDKELFLRIPPLKYELGMLHLLKRYKKTKKIFDFFFMICSYVLYTITHFIFKVLHPFLQTDFQMIKIYKKRNV